MPYDYYERRQPRSPRYEGLGSGFLSFSNEAANPDALSLLDVAGNLEAVIHLSPRVAARRLAFRAYWKTIEYEQLDQTLNKYGLPTPDYVSGASYRIGIVPSSGSATFGGVTEVAVTAQCSVRIAVWVPSLGTPRFPGGEQFGIPDPSRDLQAQLDNTVVTIGMIGASATYPLVTTHSADQATASVVAQIANQEVKVAASDPTMLAVLNALVGSSLKHNLLPGDPFVEPTRLIFPRVCLIGSRIAKAQQPFNGLQVSTKIVGNAFVFGYGDSGTDIPAIPILSGSDYAIVVSVAHVAKAISFHWSEGGLRREFSTATPAEGRIDDDTTVDVQLHGKVLLSSLDTISFVPHPVGDMFRLGGEASFEPQHFVLDGVNYPAGEIAVEFPAQLTWGTDLLVSPNPELSLNAELYDFEVRVHKDAVRHTTRPFADDYEQDGVSIHYTRVDSATGHMIAVGGLDSE